MTTPLHSKLGASSMYRWSKCPGSVKLCEGIESKSSPYAEEGTKAHELAAHLLTTQKLTCPPGYDSEMYESVCLYIETVLNQLKPDSKMLVEHRFDLSQVYPGLFGTADCVIYHPSEKRLQVIDYKHGAGIPVEIVGNLQLKYYALGALISTEYPCTEVEMIIVQPRCYHEDGPIRAWNVPASDIISFGNDVAKLASFAESENAPLVPGDHCRFCPAAGICPEIHNKALATAKEEFSFVNSYDPAKLSQALEWLPTLEAWAKNVREFAYQELMRGKEVPGFKLVAKRAVRKWVSEPEVVNHLTKEFSFDADTIYETSLKSPAQIEKLIPKNKKKDLENFIVSISSGYTIVPTSDRREEVKLDAKHEFQLALPFEDVNNQ